MIPSTDASGRGVVATRAAPAAVGPYSQAIRAGGLAYTSGQLGLDPETGELVDGGVAAETRRVLENIDAILAGAGSRLEKVVKTTVYLADLADFAEMNAAYGEFFPEMPPARATVGGCALPLGARVEIDAIALVAD